MSSWQVAVCYSATVVLLLPAARISAQDSAGAARIESAEQVIQQWNPSQHLFVKGNLGVGDAQYRRLEMWLDENAPHWTVVLMQNANNETYQALDRRTFRGMDAVEYALGRGLALRTNFSELVDPRTGETDGAVFVLFLAERRFSYYGSVAQDQRSLGESHWVGELDGPAFRAMKGGGRILDAVKDTITNINQRLDRKIAREAEQAERERQARRRALVNLQTDIEALRMNAEQVAASSAALKQRFPTATGELTTVPMEDWQRRLTGLIETVTEENVPAKTLEFNELSHEIEGYLNAFAVDATFDEVVAKIENELETLKANELSAGQIHAQEAAKQIAEARQARTGGDRGLSVLLDGARAAVAQGKQAIADEESRLALAVARRRLILRTMLVTATLLMLALVGVLVWLNRRRRPARERALQAFAKREQSVRELMDKVYGLFDRSREILGSKEKVVERGYEGATKRLTENTFEDVDDLIVMSSEVQRVIDEAREMIFPTKVSGKVLNLISSSAYEQGINRMSGEALQFDRDKGLPLVIQRESERQGEPPPEVVTLTFDSVFEAFHERLSRGEETLNTIETSLLQVHDAMQVLQDQIEQATAIDRELAEASDDDGLLATPEFFDSLIPAAQHDRDAADDITGLDPVRATQDLIPLGTRKIQDGLAIAATLQRARSEVFPLLNGCAPKLTSFGYDTAWIEDQVMKMGERANELFQAAVERSVAEDAERFSGDVTALGHRTQQTVELAEHLRDTSTPQLDTLADNIAAARARLAAELSLPETSCLHEASPSPDARLAHARELLVAAQAALQHGGVPAATEARDALAAEVTQGQGLIDRTLTILSEFDSSSRQRTRQREAVASKVPHHQELLRSMHHSYADSALLLRAGDPSYEPREATVGTHAEQCRDGLGEADRLIRDAGDKFREGCLLEAASMLDLAEEKTLEAKERLREISQHHERLVAASRENEGQLSALESKLQSLARGISDHRTMQATITHYRQVSQEFEATQRATREVLPRDPFHDASTLESMSSELAELDARLAADLDAHNEAKRAVEGSRNELRAGEALIHRARTDGIPDSPATVQSVQAIQSLAATVSGLERQLADAHQDWEQVDQAAARVHSSLSIETARLRGELDRAQQSAELLQAASGAVFAATRWSGGFGTRIFGSPGSAELERARRALSQGDYATMLQLAQAAQHAAQQAVQRAQREVERKQREAARRAEEARRRQRRHSINLGGGGGHSFGGSHRSSGGGSRSGGSSGSSGSGFSRSGW